MKCQALEQRADELRTNSTPCSAQRQALWSPCCSSPHQLRPACSPLTGARRCAYSCLATVVHFSSVLVVSLILLAPINDWTVIGALVLVCALVGIGYCGLVWRDAARDGLAAKIDLEDLDLVTPCSQSSPVWVRPPQASCWGWNGPRAGRCLRYL